MNEMTTTITSGFNQLTGQMASLRPSLRPALPTTASMTPSTQVTSQSGDTSMPCAQGTQSSLDFRILQSQTPTYEQFVLQPTLTGFTQQPQSTTSQNALITTKLDNINQLMRRVSELELRVNQTENELKTLRRSQGKQKHPVSTDPQN